MENMMQQNKKWMNKNIRDYLSKAPILQKKWPISIQVLCDENI